LPHVAGGRHPRAVVPHEQNAGYAAAIAGYLTKKPGICLTVSAPGSSTD